MLNLLFYLLRFGVFICLWSIVSLIICACVGFYFSTPEGNAFIIKTLLRLFKKSFPEFQLSRMNFLPFWIEDFHCRVAATKTSPEAVASFSKFQILVDWSLLVSPDYYFPRFLAFLPQNVRPKRNSERGKLLRFVFENFYASSPSVQFKDFLGSSAKANESLYTTRIVPKKYAPVPTSGPLALSLMKIASSFAKLMEISFQSFKFDFLMPLEGCEIHGKCDAMTVQFRDSKALGTSGLKILNEISSGEVYVIDEEVRAMEYRGQRAKICVDFFLPNGMMDVMVFLYGQSDFAWINLYPFIQFYIKYQKAEDEALEHKLARGRPTASKMNMCCELDFIKIEVVDHRMPTAPPMTIFLRKSHFEMISFPLTKDDKKTLKGRLVSSELDYDPEEGGFLPKPLQQTPQDEMSPNALKVMSAIIEKVSFHLDDFWSGNNEVEGIDAVKSLRVNNETTFIDSDLMEAKIDKVAFENMSSAMLDWLMVLQDASNRLPSSRWAHQKNVTMLVNLRSLLISTQPLAFHYDILSFKSLVHKLDAPLPQLPLDEKRSVSFVFKDYAVEMNRSFNTSDSVWTMKSRLFELRTTLPTIDLETQFHVSLLSSGKDEDLFAPNPYAPSESREEVSTSRRPFALQRQHGVLSQSFHKSADEFSYSNNNVLNKKLIFQSQMIDIENSANHLPNYNHSSSWHLPRQPSLGERSVDLENESLHSAKSFKVSQLARECPSTGTIWKFDMFDCNFTLGLTTLALHHVKSKIFLVDLINTFPDPNPGSDEEPKVFRDNFFSVNDLNAVWLNPLDVNCSLGPTFANASTAGTIKFLCGYNMIRKAVDRITARMEAMKLRFVPLPILLKAGKLPPPPPPPPASAPGKTFLSMKDLSVVIAVQNDNNKMTKNAVAAINSSIQVLRDDSFLPSAMADRSPKLSARGEERSVNKCLIVKMQNIFAELGQETTIGKFASCEMAVNYFCHSPFLAIEDFSYEKKTVFQKFSSRDPKTDKLTIAESIASKSEKVVVGELSFHLHPLMELGEVVDELLMQEAAYRTASAPRKVQADVSAVDMKVPSQEFELFAPLGLSSDDSDTESEDGVDYLSVASKSTLISGSVKTATPQPSERVPETVPPTISSLDVLMKKFRMTFDGPFENSFEDDLLVLTIEKFGVSLRQDKGEDEVQDEIAMLDLNADETNTTVEVNPDTFVVYQGITGGQLRMTMDSMFVKLSVQQEPFFEAYKMVWTGLLYNASVKDDRIPVQYKLVDVLDTMVLQPFGFADGYAESEKILIPAIVSPTDSMYVVVHKSLAPAKIYCDLSWSTETIDVHLHSHTLACLDVANRVLEISSPANLDPSPQLPLWDTLRFLFHGSFAFKCQKLTVVHHVQDYLHQSVRIKTSMVNPEWHLDHKSFEFTFVTLEVVAEMTTKVLPTRGRSTRKPKISHVLTKVCEIPSFVVALSHSRRLTLKDGRRSRLYGHHDVYLHPALQLGGYELSAAADPSQPEDLTKFLVNGEFLDEIRYLNNDRFHYFRSDKLSEIFDIEMRIADRRNEPITINLRLDNLVRIFDALGNQSTVHQRSNSQSPVLTPDQLKLLTLRPYGVQRPPSSLTLSAMLFEVKLQLIMNRVIFCSWPSAKNFFGVASLQEYTDFQVRLIRRNVEKVLPTSLINNTLAASVGAAEESRRFWDYYPTNRRLVVLRSNAEVDDKSFPLQVDHLFMEIYFGEIYVREWTTQHLGFQQILSSTRRTLNGRSLHGSLAQQGEAEDGAASPAAEMETSYEPKTVDDILDLFRPIHRLAHASKVIISLTENGEVSSRSSLFSFSGILQKRDEAASPCKPSKSCDPRNLRKTGSRAGGRANLGSDFLIGKEWRRKSLEQKLGGACGQTGPDRRSLSLLRRRTLERASNGGGGGGQLTETEGDAGRPRSTPRGPRDRKSLLFPQKNRSESAETVKEVLVKKRRESIIKADGAMLRGALSSKGRAAAGNKRLKWGAVTLGYKATLRNFVENHSAFTPPSCALPEGYRGHQIRPSNNNRLFQKGAYTDKFGYLNGLQPAADQSSFGNKIWGLKVIDCRILFTINIRDVLFSYVARCLDLFSADSSDDASASEKRDGQPTPTEDGAEPAPPQLSARRPSGINFGAGGASGKEKATLMDFLAVDEAMAQPATQKKIRRRALNSIAPGQEQGQGQGQDGADHSRSPLGRDRDRSVSPLPGARSGSRDEENEVSSVARHFLEAGRTESQDLSLSQSEFSFHEVYPEAEAEAAAVWSDEMAKQTFKTRVYHTGGRGLRRTSNTGVKGRASLQSGFSFNDADEQQEAEEAARQLEMRRSSQSLLDFAMDSPHPSATSLRSDSRRTVSTTSPKPPVPPQKKVPINQHFFIVELVDPQINFLDADKHGSLIIVAGRSSLEGKRLNTAILPPPASGTGAGEAGKAAEIEPKRRQEIRLRMDGVSAFTIPTLINFNESAEAPDGDEFEDEVFWKHLKSTSDTLAQPAHGPTPGPAPAQARHSTTATSTASLSDPTAAEDEAEFADSPFLKTAIRDFQIRALYVFWTEVTAAEAKELYVQQSKEALTCTFRLELPELAVDIFSWQFYVILNVIRNVLLVPPPAHGKRLQKGSEAEEAESAAIELARDPELLAKHDLKPNASAPLDLLKQRSLDEVRVLIEEHLAKALETSAVARFVEIFIGRVYWKLRTNSNKAMGEPVETPASPGPSAKSSKKSKSKKSNDQELVEAALTGIYATMTFFDDRRISSLFEIQRFWAKNLDPGADSKAFEDQNCIVTPILEQKDVCTRCGQEFTVEENSSTACSFHGDDDGNPGEYREKVALDELSGKEQRFKAWTCCGRTHEFAPGCAKGPHNCKEVMMSIRAEAGAPVRIENVELTVIKQLEISIFPCANYCMRLQITKSLADLLHRYFSIEAADSLEAVSSSASNSETNSSDHSTTSGGGSPSKKSKKLIPSVFKGRGRKGKKPSETASFDSDSTSSTGPAAGRRLPNYLSSGSTNDPADEPKPLASMPAGSRRSQRGTLGTGGLGAVDISQNPKAVKRQEGLYVVYLRVGDINVDVSTAGFGFAFNLDRFQAVMEKFFCKKQVLDWRRLIWQLEKHLVTSLIKNTASSSFTRLFSATSSSANSSRPRTSSALGGFPGLDNGQTASATPSAASSLLGLPAALMDGEQLQTLKRSLLLGGGGRGQKSRASIVMPKRPTLYVSPTPNPNPAAPNSNQSSSAAALEALERDDEEDGDGRAREQERSSQVGGLSFLQPSPSNPSNPNPNPGSKQRSSLPALFTSSLFASPQADPPVPTQSFLSPASPAPAGKEKKLLGLF